MGSIKTVETVRERERERERELYFKEIKGAKMPLLVIQKKDRLFIF